MEEKSSCEDSQEVYHGILQQSTFRAHEKDTELFELQSKEEKALEKAVKLEKHCLVQLKKNLSL